eukprot:TRINITY_DN9781_c0_g1_i2.p2 TRINITY_DN9781_c0_g1~~TRINITY_DN9781_c0_g1_i2.p2  ORF type:complete len:166 (+),score=44.14 TRINITY_DN9781_c0_g1_i2:79-576(+)
MIRTHPGPRSGPSQYPDSDNFRGWGYVLQHYNAQSPESVYLRDKVMPALVPALESLMAHLVEENGKVAEEAFQTQLEDECPKPTADPAETLAKELEYEHRLKWTPSRVLPDRIHNHSTKPIHWLASELRRLSAAEKSARAMEKEAKEVRTVSHTASSNSVRTLRK